MSDRPEKDQVINAVSEETIQKMGENHKQKCIARAAVSNSKALARALKIHAMLLPLGEDTAHQVLDMAKAMIYPRSHELGF